MHIKKQEGIWGLGDAVRRKTGAKCKNVLGDVWWRVPPLKPLRKLCKVTRMSLHLPCLMSKYFLITLLTLVPVTFFSHL